MPFLYFLREENLVRPEPYQPYRFLWPCMMMMLRDRLVCGVNHQGIQKRMLGEKELTYEKALEIALEACMQVAIVYRYTAGSHHT